MLQKEWEIKTTEKNMKNSTKFSFYFCLQIQFRLQQGFSNDKKVCDMLNFWKRKPSNNGNIYIIQSVDNHKGNENCEGARRKCL